MRWFLLLFNVFMRNVDKLIDHKYYISIDVVNTECNLGKFIATQQVLGRQQASLRGSSRLFEKFSSLQGHDVIDA